MFYRNGWVPLKLRPYGAIQICLLLLLLLLCPTLCYKEIQAPSKIKILPSETLVQTLDFENFATAYRSLAKCLRFSHNACIFKFHYTAPTSHYFLKLNFISKILNFTMQINVYQEGTKVNTEVNETFEEYWYALEYKAPLISTSTNFLQPSLIFFFLLGI